MTTFRPKLWTGVSAAILLAATAGCSGEAGEKGAQPNNVPAPAVGEGGEGGAEQGPGAGEKGAQEAYRAVPADSRVALRLAHLKGFLLIAQKQPEGKDAAAALVGQGMAEVFDAQPDAFKSAGVDEAVLRKAAQTGDPADINAALANVSAAQAKAGGDDAAVLKGMVDIATGIYQGVAPQGGAVDPLEYQHSYGAALAAQDFAGRSKDAKVAAAKADLDKMVTLWPAAVAPEKPTPAGQVAAQASRVELALS
ncbi:MAG: hypothetical protein ACM3YN_13500 [Parcubacteria group bacterium]